jgi:hypothetical protein
MQTLSVRYRTKSVRAAAEPSLARSDELGGTGVRARKREQAPALHRNVPSAHLECGGLSPLCGSLRGFAKIKSDGKARMPG